MAYSLVIERSQPITFEDWLSAVQQIDELKVIEISGDRIGKNPATGAEIRLPGKPIKIAVFKSCVWENQVTPFHFSKEGYIVINPVDWDDPKSLVRETAFKLAEKLNARVIADDVEIYSQSK